MGDDEDVDEDDDGPTLVDSGDGAVRYVACRNEFLSAALPFMPSLCPFFLPFGSIHR